MTEPMDRRQALRITAVAGLGLAMGGGLTASLVRSARMHRVVETRTRMGTVVTITVVHPDGPAARAMVDASFAEMERLEALLSRHRPGTPVSELNRLGALDAAPPELLELLDRADAYARLTSGAFDVTVVPLLELFGARFRDGSGRPPERAEVEAALALVDHTAVRVTDRTVRFEKPGMAVTLDGIAKGYIVDRTTAVLTAGGAERVLVNAGGDMASSGASGSDPWTVAVQDPFDPGAHVGLVRLAGACIATSGDYMNTFTEDRRHHHIVDPRTGYSPGHTSSVTVVARTAMDADALSTAVLVLGPAKGLALLESLEGVEGMIVCKDPVGIVTSSGMDRYRA